MSVSAAPPGRVAVRIIPKALAVVRAQFRLNLADGIHGLPHWSRVWCHGRRLAAALEVNPCVLAWFAFLHDSQRRNDGWDPAHGARAADFAVRLQRDGVLTELTAREFDDLCVALRWHSEGQLEGEAAVRACWDADRLDLGRVGIIPAPARLCTTYARARPIITRAVRLSQRRWL